MLNSKSGIVIWSPFFGRIISGAVVVVVEDTVVEGRPVVTGADAARGAVDAAVGLEKY